MSKRRQRPVHVKATRKASGYRKNYEDTVAIAGTREATEQGYKVSGTTCKGFETRFEHLSVHQVTDKTLHDKKTRIYRVLNGRGFAVFEKAGEQRMIKLIPGDEIAVEPGIACQLCTTGNYSLDYLIVQESKYESNMQVVEKSETHITEEEAEELITGSVSRDYLVQTQDAPKIPTRKGSKAVEQQLARAGARPVVSVAAPNVNPAGDSTFAVNLKPTMGRDLRGAEG